MCTTCEYAHILRGFRESEEIVYCNFSNEFLLVPFKVRECTNHAYKNAPTWEQMEKLAIDIRPAPLERTIGFQKRSEKAPAAKE